MHPLIPIFVNKESQDGNIEDSRAKQLDSQNTLTGLAGTKIICPSLDYQLLSTYLSHLISSGLLPNPQQIQI